MTVTNQQIEFEYIADGTTTVFPFYCRVILPSDLYVTINGEKTNNFTISGLNSDSGGNVIFNTAPVAGAIIFILRDIPIERETEYQTNGDFLATAVNNDFDRIWMALQNFIAWFKRALRYPVGGKNYDAEARQIKNLADPTDDKDAATKTYVNKEDEKVKGYVNDLINSGLGGAITTLKHGYFMLSINAEGHLILTHNDDEPTPPFEIRDGRLIYKID